MNRVAGSSIAATLLIAASSAERTLDTRDLYKSNATRSDHVRATDRPTVSQARVVWVHANGESSARTHASPTAAASRPRSASRGTFSREGPGRSGIRTTFARESRSSCRCDSVAVISPFRPMPPAFGVP